MGEALGLKPSEQLSALAFGAQFISMSPDEVLKANQKILFDSPFPNLPNSTNTGLGLSGGSYSLGPTPLLKPDKNLPKFDFNTLNYVNYDPSGQPLLKREGGFPNLLLAQMLTKNKMCTE